MCRVVILLAILLICLAIPTLAQQIGSCPPFGQGRNTCPPAGRAPVICKQSNGWTYSLTPYLWLAAIGGNAAIRGNTFGVHKSFSDIVGDVDFGFEFHLEARRDNWGYFVDPTYFKLSSSTTIDDAPADAKFKEWLVEFGGLYNIPLQLRKPNRLPQRLDALFGGRYWNLSGDLTTDGVTTSGTQSWVDPFIGLRYLTALNDRWSFLIRGDIGGFGAGSDFTWNTLAGFGYNTSPNQTAWIGYRALRVDRENGSGDDLFKWDVTYYGPDLGYEFRW